MGPVRIIRASDYVLPTALSLAHMGRLVYDVHTRSFQTRVYPTSKSYNLQSNRNTVLSAEKASKNNFRHSFSIRER